MEIIEIHLQHFGKFTNQKMKFHPGVNVIYGANETGKSTMYSFIKSMMFGLERQRGRASRRDEYTLREPWENGAYFSGIMRFSSEGEIFELERSFARGSKKVCLVRKSDEREVDTEEEGLQRFLGGMTEEAASNTVFYQKETGGPEEGLAVQVLNYVINAGSGKKIDVHQAVERLEKQRKKLEAEKKQWMAQHIERVQELSVKTDYAAQEIADLREEEKKCQKELEELSFTRDREEQRKDNDIIYKEYTVEDEEEAKRMEKLHRRPWKLGKISCAVIAAAAVAAGLISAGMNVRIGAAAVILLSCLGVRFFARLDGEAVKRQKEEAESQREQQMRRREMELRRREREAVEREAYQRERQELEVSKRNKLLLNLEWLENARQEKEMHFESLQEQYRRLQFEKNRNEELEEKLAAVYLALDTLHEVTAEIYNEYSRRLNAMVSEILGQITAGRYTGIFLDENMNIRIRAGERTLEIRQVSRGTVEQIYFALRMAAGELLDPEGAMPILLDDAFLTYDDVRLENTLRWLTKSGRQVILFTCQRREQEIMKKIFG